MRSDDLEGFGPVGTNDKQEEEHFSGYLADVEILRLQQETKRLREALKEVMRYRRGEGEFNFSRPPLDQRHMESFDAWQQVELKILRALKGET